MISMYMRSHENLIINFITKLLYSDIFLATPQDRKEFPLRHREIFFSDIGK